MAVRAGYFLAGAVVGLVLGTAVLVSHAWDSGAEPADAVTAAEPDPPPGGALERRVACVVWFESRGNPTAINPRSGASGLGQFLRSTWLTTPQGQAGYSVFDPVANRAAIVWMFEQGRAREFSVVLLGLC